MGLLVSRQQGGDDVETDASAYSYRFPAKSGPFFGSDFLMGGERFESPSPEAYLFGDNSDLNFLGSKPVHFPYAQTQSTEPTRTLQCLVNIRRESLKFTKVRDASETEPTEEDTTSTEPSINKDDQKKDVVNHTMSPDDKDRNSLDGEELNKMDEDINNHIDADAAYTKRQRDNDDNREEEQRDNESENEEDKTPQNSEISQNPQIDTHSQTTTPTPIASVVTPQSTRYTLDFTFDCDVPCAITVYYFATESILPSSGLTFVSKSPELTSETYHYPSGASQRFCQKLHVFDPSLHRIEQMSFDLDSGQIPVVVHCVTTGDVNEGPQSHATYGIVVKSAEGHGYVLKPLKQKQFVNGVCYLLHEIYGIENKNPSFDQNGDAREEGSVGEDLFDENGADCVVCMSELRDTIILPCRHLCLCNACAETLRYKASNCPICRSPFRALLQIKTLRRLGPVSSSSVPTQYNPGGQASFTDSEETTSPMSSAFSTTRYETITLLEALNGPIDHTQTCVSLPATHAAHHQGHNQGASNTHHGGSLGLPTSQSAPAISGLHPQGVRHGTGATPRPPPRGRRRGRKKQPRVVAPIQEVLTAAAIQGVSNPTNRHSSVERRVTEIEMKPVRQKPDNSTRGIPNSGHSVAVGEVVSGLEQPTIESDEEILETVPTDATRIVIDEEYEDQDENDPDDINEDDIDGTEDYSDNNFPDKAEDDIMMSPCVGGSNGTLERNEGLETPRSNYSIASFSSTNPLLPTTPPKSNVNEPDC